MSTLRYSKLSIALHWLMLALLVAVYACMELRGYAARGSELRANLKDWHYLLGLSVFALVWVRLAARWFGGSPGRLSTTPVWQHRLAAAVHLLLYAFMLGMPLIGWLLLSAEGETVSLIGLDLPALLGKDGQLAEQLEDLHETIATIGYVLVGIHAAAALFHHYVLKDATLRRMLP
jgi:cytochrome b561